MAFRLYWLPLLCLMMLAGCATLDSPGFWTKPFHNMLRGTKVSSTIVQKDSPQTSIKEVHGMTGKEVAGLMIALSTVFSSLIAALAKSKAKNASDFRTLVRLIDKHKPGGLIQDSRIISAKDKAFAKRVKKAKV